MKDSSEFFHVQSMCYKSYVLHKAKSKLKHLCFREHLAGTPLSHFVHTVLDLLEPMAWLFRLEQTVILFFFPR